MQVAFTQQHRLMFQPGGLNIALLVLNHFTTPKAVMHIFKRNNFIPVVTHWPDIFYVWSCLSTLQFINVATH